VHGVLPGAVEYAETGGRLGIAPQLKGAKGMDIFRDNRQGRFDLPLAILTHRDIDHFQVKIGIVYGKVLGGEGLGGLLSNQRRCGSGAGNGSGEGSSRGHCNTLS